jgi:hypothetical protein
MTDLPAEALAAIDAALAELPQPSNPHERDRWTIVSRIAANAAAPLIAAAERERLATWIESPEAQTITANAIRAQVDQEIAAAVAAERERIRQLANDYDAVYPVDREDTYGGEYQVGVPFADLLEESP